MRISILCVLLFAAGLAAQAVDLATAKSPPAAIETIVSDDLLAHASFLASDERNGRLTGSPGQQAAADYIADHFRQLGLEPLGDRPAEPNEGESNGERSFLQHYGIKRTFVRAATRLKLGELELERGFAVLGGREMDVSIAGPLRFCGLGRTRGRRADLPADESLDGKIAVVAIRGPRGRVREGLTVEQKFGMSFGTFGRLGRTAKALAEKGAQAVLFVQHEDPFGMSDVLNYLALSPGKDSIEANFPGADPGMGGLGRLGGRGGVPTLVLSVPASHKLLGELGIAVDALRNYVDGSGELPTGKADVSGALKIAVGHDDEATATNVVALLRGSDEQLRNEAVIYSAHMDHVGVRLDGDVFNGADDNASGSAGLLAIATAFANAKQPPKRSVIFLSVSGEELGLWGVAVLLRSFDLAARQDHRRHQHRHDWSQRSGIGANGSDRYAKLSPREVLDAGPRCSVVRQGARDEVRVGRQVLRPQRSLQLRQEGHPGGVLLQRRARGLPPGQRSRRQARRRQDAAHCSVGFLDWVGGGERRRAANDAGSPARVVGDVDRAAIDRFLAVGSFAVVGASADRGKYGNKVLRCYAQHGLPVVGVHPKLTAVEGAPVYASLRAVPGDTPAVSVVAPPAAAVSIVDDAVARGVKHLWFQPGAEEDAAIADAVERGIEVIAHGPCVLVALGFRDE